MLPAILDGEYYSSLCGDVLSHAACSFLLEDSYCIFLYVAVATHTGLADENESVRDAALGAGHVLVEHYATTYDSDNSDHTNLLLAHV